MDSFYDQPRKNIFLPKNLDLQIPITPEVTKASLLVTDQIKDSICENKQMNRITSYNVWRQQNEQRFLKKQEKKQSSSKKPVELLKEPFERLYLTNIPNRQLDCSLLTPEISDSKKNGLALKKDYSSENDLKNKENLKPAFQTFESNKEKQQIANPDNDLNSSHLKQILDKLESLNNSSQESQLPTVQELYKVIDKKDEQIKNLESQVETLLRINSSLLQFQEQQLTVSKANTIKEDQKISVGLMTSFAVSLNNNLKSNSEEIKQRNAYKKSKNQQFLFENRTNSFNEESFSNNSQSDDSNDTSEAAFNGVHFSLDNSFDNSLDEYHSDGEINNGLSRNSDTGLTFYDNIMGQVNQFLGNKSNKSSMKKNVSSEANNMDYRRESNSIKKVTKLQNKNCSNDYNDVSAVVKKVLVKYLPQIEEVGRNKRKERHKMQNNVEASFTTLQYQKKYCLVQSQYENRNDLNYVPSKNKKRHHVRK